MQSRRSNTNLSYLTLAPLSSRLPLDDDEEDVQVPAPWTQRTSYITGKSAPTTPAILSRNTSQTRLGPSTSNKLAGSRSYTNLAFEGTAALSKSKSTSAMYHTRDGSQSQAKRKKTKSSLLKPMSATDQGEWLYRAGAAITSEARESKGQSWLVSRESSTSLVAQNPDDGFAPQVLDPTAGEMNSSLYSARGSRNPSRIASRTTSAKTSRRGSRVGSRADLTYFATPTGLRSALARDENAVEDYFGQLQPLSAVSGPDFVDAEEEDDDEEIDDDDDEELRREEENEVAKLASDRGFGLGNMVDRLIGWTLFDVKEDSHEGEEDELDAAEQMQQAPKREKNLTTQQSHITKQSSGARRPTVGDSEEAQGGWADAAWLLSVASKVIL